VIEVLEEGDIFGEISIFSNLRRTATVRSSECCLFQTLDKEAFQTIQKRYPSIYSKLEDYMSCYNDED